MTNVQTPDGLTRTSAPGQNSKHLYAVDAAGNYYYFDRFFAYDWKPETATMRADRLSGANDKRAFIRDAFTDNGEWITG